MLLLSMEVLLGDCVERMQLAFPVLTLDPLLPRAALPARRLWNPNRSPAGSDIMESQLSTKCPFG